MNQTIVLYNCIPSKLVVAVLENDTLTPEELEVFDLVHGRAVNFEDLSSEEHAAANKVYAALCEKTEYLPSEHPEGSFWAQRWVKGVQKIEKGSPPLAGLSASRVVLLSFGE